MFLVFAVSPCASKLRGRFRATRQLGRVKVGEREHHGPNQRGQYYREPEVVAHSAAIPRYDSGA